MGIDSKRIEHLIITLDGELGWLSEARRGINGIGPMRIQLEPMRQDYRPNFARRETVRIER